MPSAAQTISFADHIALVVVKKQFVEVTILANEAVAFIQRWLISIDLAMANQ